MKCFQFFPDKSRSNKVNNLQLTIFVIQIFVILDKKSHSAIPTYEFKNLRNAQVTSILCEILLARGTELLIQGTVCKASVKQNRKKKHKFEDFPRTTRKKQMIHHHESIKFCCYNARGIIKGKF